MKIKKEETFQKAHKQMEMDLHEKIEKLTGINEQLKLEIEQLKQTEKILRKSENSFKRAQKMGMVGSWEWDLLHNKTVWSDELYNIFGVKPEQFDPDAYEAFLNCIYGEDRQFVQEAIEKSIKDKTGFDIEYRIVKPDGTLRDIHARGEVFCNEAADPVKLVGTSQDITERKRAVIRLKQTETIGRIGNWEFDLSNNNIVWSDQVYELFGRDPDLGPPTVEEEAKYYSKEVINRLRNYAEQVIKTGEPVKDYEFPVIKGNGDTCFFVGSMFPRKNKKGRIIKLFGIFQDITTRKEAQQEITRHLEFEKYISELASHFINLPTNKLETEITKALQWMVNYFGVDRVTLLKLSNDKKVLQTVNFYTTDTIKPVMEINLKSLHPAIWSKLQNGNPFNWSAVDEFNDEVHTDLINLDQLGAKSVVIIPVMVGDFAEYILTIASLKKIQAWDRHLIPRIQIMGRLFVSVMQQKKSRNELKASELRYKTLFQYSGTSIVLFDKERKLMLLNEKAARDLGGKPEDFEGKSLSDLFPKAIAEKYYNLAEQVFETAIGREFEVTLPLANGEKTYKVIEQAVKDLNGNVMFVQASGLDITERKQAEEKFRGVLESAPDAMVITDKNGVIQLINNQTEKLFGYNSSELIGKNVEILMPQQYRGIHIKHRQDYKKVPKTRIMGEGMELLGLRKNGKEFPVEVSLSPIDTREGIMISSVIRDITLRKEEQDILQQSTRSLNEAQRLAHLGDWEWDMVNDQVKWSDELYKILGYEQSKFKASREAFLNRVHPQDRPNLEKHILALITENKPFTIDHRILLSDGTVKYCHSLGSLVYDDKNNPIILHGIVQDITERKLAEDALRKSESNLASAQRIAHLGSWERNLLTNKVTWSDEMFEIFGLDKQHFKVTYKSFIDRVHPEDRHSLEEALSQAISEPEKKLNIQFRIIRLDGTQRIVQGRGEVRFDEDGKPLFLVGTLHDLTEVKTIEAETRQLRNELAHVNRVNTVGNMASAIAHEINQPLAAILSNSQAAIRLLNIDPPDLTEVHEALTDIVSADKRAGEVIRRIRALVKKEEIKSESYNINHVIREVIGLVQNEAIIQSTSLRSELDSQIPVLYGDHIQIQQVILNLIMNALEAVKNQPANSRSIVVSTRTIGNQGVIVRVTDSGKGVDKENIDNVFDAFYTTKTKGMGLGLSVCHSIIENHGGRIWAENNADGGAKFSFELPLKKDGN